MTCDQSWAFFEGELDSPDVRDLLALHFAAMRAGSPPDACHVLPADELGNDGIRFLSLRCGSGKLLGVGALKRIGPAEGEIKSMRTLPAVVGKGVGRALLTQLIGMAYDDSLHRLFLETGSTAAFASALALYRRTGFKPCPPFGDYAPSSFTTFLSLDLPDVSPTSSAPGKPDRDTR